VIPAADLLGVTAGIFAEKRQEQVKPTLDDRKPAARKRRSRLEDEGAVADQRLMTQVLQLVAQVSFGPAYPILKIVILGKDARPAAAAHPLPQFREPGAQSVTPAKRLKSRQPGLPGWLNV